MMPIKAKGRLLLAASDDRSVSVAALQVRERAGQPEAARRRGGSTSRG